MKKKLLTLLLAAVLVFSLAACGDSEATGTMPSGTEKTEPTSETTSEPLSESTTETETTSAPTSQTASEPASGLTSESASETVDMSEPENDASAELFEYTGDASTGIVITKLKDEYVQFEEIIIPKEIDGIPVVEIAKFAFKDCTHLISIKIPDSVTGIGAAAFGSCRSLASIEIPDSVTTIDNTAFVFCSSLTKIKWKGNTYSDMYEFLNAFNAQ